jgi:hypothetical protein
VDDMQTAPFTDPTNTIDPASVVRATTAALPSLLTR